jgi:hypothetical protein
MLVKILVVILFGYYKILINLQLYFAVNNFCKS